MEQPHVDRTPELHVDRSPELNELFAALSKAQAEMDLAGLNSKNPFFKSNYASFGDLVKASRTALAKYGLSVTQLGRRDSSGQPVLYTVLGHSSGQWIGSYLDIAPAKPDIQSVGSCISYLKRYLYAAITGVVVSDDSDDDGESDRQSHQQGYSQPKYQRSTATAKAQPLKAPEEKITKEQLEEIHWELQEWPEIGALILKAYGIATLADIPKSKYRLVRDQISANVKAEGGK